MPAPTSAPSRPPATAPTAAPPSVVASAPAATIGPMPGIARAPMPISQPAMPPVRPPGIGTLADLLAQVLPGIAAGVRAPQIGLDVLEAPALVALVVGGLVAAPVVRLGIGEGTGVGGRTHPSAPLAEVLLEGRPVAA